MVVHRFAQLGLTEDIELRIIKPSRPQTNGVDERFNERIADIFKITRYDFYIL